MIRVVFLNTERCLLVHKIGGAVAAGSTVAVLQSIGAAGLGSALVPIVAVGALLCAGIAGAVFAVKSSAVSPATPRVDHFLRAKQQQSGDDPIALGRWVVAREEGWGNVLVYFFACEKDARDAFRNSLTDCVLFNPAIQEVEGRGRRQDNIRRVVNDNMRRCMERACKTQ